MAPATNASQNHFPLYRVLQYDLLMSGYAPWTRIFGPKRDGVTGEWRKLHNEELNDLYCSPNTVRVVKSRMRWAGNVARMQEGEVCTRFWWGNLRERGQWGHYDVDGRIILRWILRKWEGVVGTGWSWLRIGTGGGRL